jgi:hypothetical protein
MIRSLLVVVLGLAANAAGTASAQAVQAPPATPPAAQAARPQRAAPAGRPVNITVNVTDGRGLGIAGAQVTLSGPVTREGSTVADGSFRALGLKPGDYRFRFERDDYITLERDVTIRSGQPTEVDVMLSRAPEAPKPEPAAPAPPQPAAKARTSSPLPAASFDVTSYLEREYLKSGPSRVKSVACSASDSVDLVQTTTSWSQSAGDHQLAVVAIAGQGRATVAGRSFRIDSRSGTTITVPTGSGFEATREGKNTLVFVVVSIGEGCRAGE